MDKIINHAVLSLDFWQDTVTYEGCAMPTGTIGCEVLNISAEAIETLTPPCDTMNRLLQGMNTGTVDLTLLPQVQGAASGILSFMDVTWRWHSATAAGCPSTRQYRTKRGRRPEKM